MPYCNVQASDLLDHALALAHSPEFHQVSAGSLHQDWPRVPLPAATKALLGRDLTEEEARYVTDMVRRIAEIILLGPALNASYEAVKAAVWQWGEE